MFRLFTIEKIGNFHSKEVKIYATQRANFLCVIWDISYNNDKGWY